MKLLRTATRHESRALRVQAGALSLSLHVALIAGFALLPGRAPVEARRVVTLLPPTEVVASFPEPLEEAVSLSEVEELPAEDQLDEPETQTQVFPPEPPEPPPQVEPLPIDDPRGVRVRAAPFTALPAKKLEPEAEESLAPPAEADTSSAAEEPDAPGAVPADEPGPTRGPLFVDGPEPEYPALSRRLNEEGSILCRLFVGADGRVRRVEIVRSSGHARLDRAAVEALRLWRFEAALDEGQAVPAEFTHTVRFRLK